MNILAADTSTQILSLALLTESSYEERLVDGHPASFEDPIVLVGAVDHYEPRCRHCHEILNKPHKF